MKRTVSAVIAVVVLFNLIFSGAFSAYAAKKMYAVQALQQVQTKAGFIPGQKAAVTGNCYAFVSKVCEALYGKSYAGEQLYNGYQCKHATGNFYTVATLTTGTTADAATIENIINFFVRNAAVGDVVHYAALGNPSSTHTVMIQSVDSEKLCYYHANYPTKEYDQNACHIDTIYWDSFRRDSTKTAYDESGKTYSMNALFYSKMKNGGLGISINRYARYSDMYFSVPYAPSVTAARSSSTGMRLSWTPISDAVQYEVQYKLAEAPEFTTVMLADAALSEYTIEQLETGKTYQFQMRALVGTEWTAYSDVISKSVLPPTVTSAKFTPQANGLLISWAKKTDLTNVNIYKEINGNFELLATLDKTAASYVDTDITYGKSYAYKIQRCMNEYSTTSKALTGKYELPVPAVSVAKKSPTAVNIQWQPIDSATSYALQYRIAGGSWQSLSCSGNRKTVSKLKTGKKYEFRMRAVNQIGQSAYSTKQSVKVLPPTPETPRVKSAKKGVKISWTPQSYAKGYYIYKAYSKNGKYTLLKTVRGNQTKSYTDKSVRTGKKYYYKIVCFTKKNGAEHKSAKSAGAVCKFTK